MKRITIIAVGLAVVLLTAGTAAAVAGTTPAIAGDNAQADEHAQNDEHPPDHAANASDAPRDAADGERGASVAQERAPPVDLPGAVPDHVSEIHDLIRQFVAGDLDGSLGDAIADVTPGDETDES